MCMCNFLACKGCPRNDYTVSGGTLYSLTHLRTQFLTNWPMGKQ